MEGFFVIVILVSRNIAYASPVLHDFFMLATKLDEEAPGEDFPIIAVADEVDGVNLHF